MELNVIEDKKNHFEFELTDVNHEFCIALQEQLYQDKDVSVATYKIDHPLVKKVRFFVETKSKSPREIIKNAVKEILKDNKKILTKLENAL